MAKNIAFIILMALTTTIAQGSGPQSSFWDIIEEFNNCEGPTCEQIYEEKELVSEGTLPAALEKALMEVAEDQVRVWGDTILEGGYITRGETELNEVVAIYKNKKLIAYRIIYSQAAINTDSCDYDYENEETLEDCTEGRITETSIVSPDFKEYDIDGDGYANFED
ncbi:hypothetical protein AZI86_07980 [Bdellovibrio bacteriovorus]|uniref:EF-hand domain-containing protein n=1 Tax=Bdellovibrio bacteriovorus TaxID=959 RepID=A0A150WR34_BDEBC|nr:hypothetical protein [Bdellovibrio bacteriovorus]KYG66953.1 hypothetical protein AZI86_07980 [Bdellovibrio bacteriovorus]